MAEAVRKLNLPKRSDTYSRMPLSVFYKYLPMRDKKGRVRKDENGETILRKINFSEADLFAEVYSFSHLKKNPSAQCERSYSDLQKKIGRARSTVAAGLKSCKEGGIIEQTKRFHDCAAYTCRGVDLDGFYIQIEDYLKEREFEIPIEACTRRVTGPEVWVESYIASLNNVPVDENGTRKGYCDVTVEGVAETLGICQKIVRDALIVLVSAGFMVCKNKLFGCRKDRSLRFCVRSNVLNLMNHKPRRASEPVKKGLSDQELAADQRTEWERHHALNRDRANRIAQKNEELAMQDEEFRTVSRLLSPYEFQIAKAEHGGLREEVQKLIGERIALQARRAVALARLGIKEEDLKPKYTCPKCSDTGFLPNGRMCGCYDPPGGDP